MPTYTILRAPTGTTAVPTAPVAPPPVFRPGQASARVPGYTPISTLPRDGGDGFGGNRPASVVNFVLSWASEPGSAVAHSLRGDFLNAGRSLLNFSLPITKPIDRLESPDAFVSDTPVIRRQLNRLPVWLRIPSSIGIDIATDPLTYLTFGASGASRVAARGGREVVRDANRARTGIRALREARRVTARERVAEAAEDLATRLTGAFRVNARLPLPTRTIEKTLLETTRPLETWRSIRSAIVKRAAEGGRGSRTAAAVTRAGEAVGENIRSTRGGNLLTRTVAQAARRWRDEEIKHFTKLAEGLQDDIFKRAKSTPYSGTELSEILTRHLDNPARYDLPEGVFDLADRARRLLDEMDELDRAAGLDYGRRTNYVPHLILDRKQAEEYARHIGQDTAAARVDRPFFVHNRQADTLDDLERMGFTPETNLPRLVQARARASATGRAKRAVDDEFIERFAVSRPDYKVPNLDGALSRLDKSVEHLDRLLNADGVVEGQAELKAAREAVRQDMQLLKAAGRTGDAGLVAKARDELRQSTAAYNDLAQNRVQRDPRTPVADITPTGPENLQVFNQTLNRMVARHDYNRVADEVRAGTGTPAEVRRAGRVLDENQRALDDARNAPLRRVRGDEDAEFASRKSEWRREKDRAYALRNDAEKALRKAVRSKHQPSIDAATRALADARRMERKAANALDREYRRVVARGPRIAKAAKVLERNQAAVARIEKRVDKLIDRNMKLATQGRQLTRAEWKQVQDEFNKLAGEWVKFPGRDGVALPADAAREYDRFLRYLQDSMRTPNEAATFVRNVQTRWKALALATPGFHIRNIQDDMLRAWMGGARSPLSWVKAARVMRKTDGSMKLGGVTYTHREMWALAQSEGIVDTGWTHSDVVAMMDAIKNQEKRGRRFGEFRPSAPGSGRWASLMRHVGEVRDTWTRLGMLIEKLRQGEHIADAADITRAVLLDYGDLSHIVRVAKDYYVPFITFMSKIIPQTVKQFAREPRIPANINKVITTLQEEAGNPDLSDVPEGLEQAFGLPSFLAAPLQAAGGVDQDNALLFNPERVFGYGTLDMLDPRDVQQTAFGAVSPFIRVPVELGTGYSTFRGREFPKSGVRAPALARYVHDYIPGADRLPIWGERDDSVTGETVRTYNPYLDTLLNLFPPYGQTSAVTGRLSGDSTESSRIAFLRVLAGLSISPYDQALAAAYAEKYGR